MKVKGGGMIMKIIKKIKCLHCNSEIEGENVKCVCGKVVIVENSVPSNLIKEVDYKDLTPKLLVE